MSTPQGVLLWAHTASKNLSASPGSSLPIVSHLLPSVQEGLGRTEHPWPKREWSLEKWFGWWVTEDMGVFATISQTFEADDGLASAGSLILPELSQANIGLWEP